MKNKVIIIGIVIFFVLVIFFFPKTYVREAPAYCGSGIIRKCIGISSRAPSSNECSLTDVCFGWKVKAD
jgi:hypothetical protein